MSKRSTEGGASPRKKGKRNQATFDELPADVISKICSYLSPADLKNATLSCKRWNYAINDDPRLTRDIWFNYTLHTTHYNSATEMKRKFFCIKFARLPPEQEYQLLFLNTSRCVRSVELTVDTGETDVRDLKKFIEYFSNTTSLALKQDGSADDFVWTNTVPDALNLESLISLEISLNNSPQFLIDSISLAANSKLRSFKLDCTSLNMLSIEQKSRVVEALGAFFNQQTYLKELQLCGLTSAQDPLFGSTTALDPKKLILSRGFMASTKVRANITPNTGNWFSSKNYKWQEVLALFQTMSPPPTELHSM